MSRFPTTHRTLISQLRVLAEEHESGYPDHPFYWGAFVAAGDWR